MKICSNSNFTDITGNKYNMWIYKQYYLDKLRPDKYYGLQDKFFMLDENNVYVCFAIVYDKIERVADTKVMRALLC